MDLRHGEWQERWKRRLDVFENVILRLICGAVCESGVWRRRHNAEISEMTGVPLLSDVVRSHRLRWAGHVAEERRKACCRWSWMGYRRAEDLPAGQGDGGGTRWVKICGCWDVMETGNSLCRADRTGERSCRRQGVCMACSPWSESESNYE